MILAWENEKPVLAPMAGEVSASGEQMHVSLGRSDRWQFDLWQLARAAIDQPSPPTRDANAQGPVPSAVLVAGLEGLAFHQIELLKKLATLRSVKGIQCNVKVLLVHPSSSPSYSMGANSTIGNAWISTEKARSRCVAGR